MSLVLILRKGENMGRTRHLARKVAEATVAQSVPKGIPNCTYAIPTGGFLVGIVDVRGKQLCDSLGTSMKMDDAIHKASSYRCHTYYAVVYDDTRNPIACYMNAKRVQL